MGETSGDGRPSCVQRNNEGCGRGRKQLLSQTNGTAGQGTEGQDRQLLDTNPAVIITGNSITGYVGALPTGPSGTSAVNPIVRNRQQRKFSSIDYGAVVLCRLG